MPGRTPIQPVRPVERTARTAPRSTTKALLGVLGDALMPWRPFRRRRRWARMWNPYATVADMNGLGFVLTQGGGWEINRTLPGGAPYLKPFDPLYNPRGEQGLYYDTQLGAIPTDAEIGPNECYTPVQSAWIYAKEGYIPPPYVPPSEWRPVAAQYGPPTSLGEATAADAAVQELSRHQRRMFYLTAMSTAAIVTVASINIYRAMKQRG